MDTLTNCECIVTRSWMGSDALLANRAYRLPAIRPRLLQHSNILTCYPHHVQHSRCHSDFVVRVENSIDIQPANVNSWLGFNVNQRNERTALMKWAIAITIKKKYGNARTYSSLAGISMVSMSFTQDRTHSLHGIVQCKLADTPNLKLSTVIYILRGNAAWVMGTSLK